MIADLRQAGRCSPEAATLRDGPHQPGRVTEKKNKMIITGHTDARPLRREAA
ncbi:hypothetical protein OK016_27385 [Vibrio chagasii]|nr:hypothetical protein [Vibrio chagasii]